MRKLLVASALAFASLGAGQVHADTDHPINDPTTGVMVATRLNNQVQLTPPPTAPPIVDIGTPPVLWSTASSNGRCTGMLTALNYWNPGWPVDRMAGIAYRESRCDPNASNSCCSGIFQIHRIWISKLGMCGVYSRSDLYDPWKNVCAASVVFRQQGIGAWSTA